MTTDAGLVPPADLGELAIVDGHCHPLLMEPWDVPVARLLDLFTEGRPGTMTDHVASTAYFRRALRDLARHLGVDARPEAILDARRRRGADVTRHLLSEAKVTSLLVDTGYPPEAMSLEQMRQTVPCAIHEIFRIETCAQRLLLRSLHYPDFVVTFREQLVLAAEHCVAFKTIVAYRSGLGLSSWSLEEVTAAYGRAVAETRARGAIRLTDKPLLDSLVAIALDVAQETGLPLQIHAGFGDPDIDLLQANPLLLRPVLEDPRWAGVRLVILHLAYPYVREASFMAAVWPQVYVDLSLALPFLGAGAVLPLVEVLSLAPSTKLLYGSDLGSLPELFALAADWGRSALGEALAWLGRREGWSADETRATARRILADNAIQLYGLS
jgi:predicted TIM-barrel fold metal-dependent hydrolase